MVNVKYDITLLSSSGFFGLNIICEKKMARVVLFLSLVFASSGAVNLGCNSVKSALKMKGISIKDVPSNPLLGKKRVFFKKQSIVAFVTNKCLCCIAL